MRRKGAVMTEISTSEMKIEVNEAASMIKEEEEKEEEKKRKR